MEILTHKEVLKRKDELLRKIKQGAVFIYPTDTIYGIGCDARSEIAVEKIRILKQRPKARFSIWAPSKQWIHDHCDTSNPQIVEALDMLPGPYTLGGIPIKDRSAIAHNVSFRHTIGIRIPDHWLKEFFAEAGIPIVTTSANKHGEPFMTSLESLDSDIQKDVEFMIYEGEKKGRPSKIIDFETDEVIER